MFPQSSQNNVIYTNRFTGNVRFKKVFKLTIVLLIFLALIVVGLKLLLPDNSPKGIANRFVSDIVAGQAAEAYALTSSGFKDQITSNQWSNDVSVLHATYTSKATMESSSSNFSPNSVPVVTFVVSGSRNKYKLTVFLTYVDKRWQVQYFSSSTT